MPLPSFFHDNSEPAIDSAADIASISVSNDGVIPITFSERFVLFSINANMLCEIEICYLMETYMRLNAILSMAYRFVL